MDKSPFNSPSPQDSPRLPRFTQHHWPVIALHRGIVRSPHPSSALHFPTTSILQQRASTYFPHTAICYPPHLNPQDPLKDLMSLACDPASRQPGLVSAGWPTGGGGGAATRAGVRGWRRGRGAADRVPRAAADSSSWAPARPPQRCASCPRGFAFGSGGRGGTL
nr:nuclear factor 1 C-type-like [Oryctolagus cuniculus]